MLWSDEVIADETPVSSARMLVNMFLVDSDREASEAVVAARLPYTRVEIDGSNEFTFLSNDVVRIPHGSCNSYCVRYSPA